MKTIIPWTARITVTPLKRLSRKVFIIPIRSPNVWKLLSVFPLMFRSHTDAVSRDVGTRHVRTFEVHSLSAKEKKTRVIKSCFACFRNGRVLRRNRLICDHCNLQTNTPRVPITHFENKRNYFQSWMTAKAVCFVSTSHCSVR